MIQDSGFHSITTLSSLPSTPVPIRHFPGISQSVKSRVHCMFPLFLCWAFVIKWPARRWEFVIVDFHVFLLALFKMDKSMACTC